MTGMLKGAVLIFSPVFLILGCYRQITDNTIPLNYPGNFSVAGELQVPGRWWTLFENQELNAAVDSGLQTNFSLEAAWQRVMVARAIADREASSFFPHLDALFEGDVTNEAGSDEQPNFRIGLSSTYEIDLWGRIRSSVKAQRFRSDASYSDYQTTAITLSSEIVRTWFGLTEAGNQVSLILEQIRTNEQVLDVMRNRFGSGQIRAVDILRQNQLLESTREQHILAETRIQLLKYQLAVLLGKIPGGVSGPEAYELPELPPFPATGIPSEILHRRPDVQSAYNLLLAADRDLASAISSRYPRISLSGSLYSKSDNSGKLLNDWAYAIAGDLIGPIFQGGRLKAEVNRTKAVKRQLFFEYTQTLLDAFREVEDALARESRQKEVILTLNAQVELARKAYEQLRIEYFNGFGNYLEVLTALGQEQQLRRDLLNAKMTLLDYRIDLYGALAGGLITERESAT